MKRLSDIYECDIDVEVKGVKINSREVEPGDLFVCTVGVTANRHDFIDDAVKRGAAALVVSRDVVTSVPYIKVTDTNEALPILCSNFYDNPEKKLELYGITGTDGKTTVATITQTLIGDDICGYLGTNGRRCHFFDKEVNNTTPDADKYYGYFKEFVDANCTKLVMETSSEAFFRNRLNNLKFKIGAITNITKEHLNIHGSFENYITCKCQLFENILSDGYAILNKDDSYYEEIRRHCNCKVLTYGKDETNDMQIVRIKITSKNTGILYRYNNKEYEIISPLLGEFNVYNLACGILIAIASGCKMEDIISNVSKLKVSGRLEMLPDFGQKFQVMVDYAHTPNGISNLLKFVNTLNVKRSIVVIGSAGERDYLKRPVMGKTVIDNASYAIFTYEDPRSEDPIKIIEVMTSEIQDQKERFEIIVDRGKAIKKAIDMASVGDIVLILGKGNETYQKLSDRTIYFNDIKEALKCLEERIEKEKIAV